MNTQDDLYIWQEQSNAVRIGDLVCAYANPCPFQTELAAYISGLFHTGESPSSLEVGSSFGVTSALLPPHFQKSLLDYDEVALKKGAEFFETIGQPVDTINFDILKADAGSLYGRYELVFSAGLLEHFTGSERRTIIEKMVRYTKIGGYTIIAVPNHLSLPYRFAYLGLVSLKRWDYPKEHKINDFSTEIEGINGVVPVAEVVLDSDGVYSLYPGFLAGLAKSIGRICNFEGYLKVFVFQRKG